MTRLEMEDTSLDQCIREAGTGRVVVTRNGRPVAVVIGLHEDQVEYATDPEFWKLIQERRQQPTVSWDEMEARLAADESGDS